MCLSLFGNTSGKLNVRVQVEAALACLPSRGGSPLFLASPENTPHQSVTTGSARSLFCLAATVSSTFRRLDKSLECGTLSLRPVGSLLFPDLFGIPLIPQAMDDQTPTR